MSRLLKPMLWGASLAAFVAYASLAQAESIYVANASFESPTVPEAGYLYADPESWEGSDGINAGYTINGVGGSTVFSNASGSQLALFYVADFGDGLRRSYLRQTLGTIHPNTSYTAQLDVGALSTVPGDSGTTFAFTLAWGFTDGNSGNGTLARVDIAATDVGSSSLTTFTINSGNIAADNPAVGRDLTIWLLGSGATPGGASCCFVADNARVTSAVPEPTTMTVLLTGLAGLLAYAWRKQK